MKLNPDIKLIIAFIWHCFICFYTVTSYIINSQLSETLRLFAYQRLVVSIISDNLASKLPLIPTSSYVITDHSLLTSVACSHISVLQIDFSKLPSQLFFFFSFIISLDINILCLHFIYYFLASQNANCTVIS